MPSVYQLSLVIDGPGTSAESPSHWSLALHKAPPSLCTILQVLVLEEISQRKIYGFSRHNGVDIYNMDSVGRVLLVETLPARDYGRTLGIIEKEPPPQNKKGEKDNSQNWVVDVLISLEVEELVPAGTAEMVGGWIGRSAEEVRIAAGDQWIGRDDR